MNASAWSSRCWARVLASKAEAAVADCTESLRLTPNDSDTLDSRGFAKLKLNRPDQAMVDFDEALRLTPKLASSLYGRGLARLKKGDTAWLIDVAPGDSAEVPWTTTTQK